PNPDLSHGISTDIWHTANINQGTGLGWLGRYADSALKGIKPLPAAAIGFAYAPRIVLSQKVTVPLIAKFGESGFKTPGAPDRDVIMPTFRDLNLRSFPADSVISQIAEASIDAERNSGLLNQALATYQSS